MWLGSGLIGVLYLPSETPSVNLTVVIEMAKNPRFFQLGMGLGMGMNISPP